MDLAVSPGVPAARVVRYVSQGNGGTSLSRSTGRQGPTAARMVLWQAAIGAVARAWSDASVPPQATARWHAAAWIGSDAPGPGVHGAGQPDAGRRRALAAGRFQPLVRMEPSIVSLGDPRDAGRVNRLGDVLTLPQAVRFVRRLEGRVASVTPHYDQLGDDCDFFMIAGDWHRYLNDVDRGTARGIEALDDLIVRELVAEPDPKVSMRLDDAGRTRAGSPETRRRASPKPWPPCSSSPTRRCCVT